MKTTLTFTEEHIEELKRIASLGVFASKVASTILSRDTYRASSKQVDILNKVSSVVFYISDDYTFEYMDRADDRQRNLWNIR